MRHPPRASVRHTRTVSEILRYNLPTLFNCIALLCAALLFVAGDSFHVSFLPMVLLTAALHVAAELTAKRTMERLHTPEMPAVLLLHAGGHEERDASTLNGGDLIRLDAGSPVPADCVVESGGVLTDRSLINGQSAHVARNEGDLLLAGATVVQGACTARVTATGEASDLYRMELDARRRPEPRSEMQNGLRRLLRVLAALAIPICLAKWLVLIFHGKGLLLAAASAASSLMGMLPAALLLLSAAAMLLAAAVLARQNVLARDLYSVEMFGRIDTLCFDKTGTLTCGTAADVIRGGARETLAFFREQGIDLRILTGDAPEIAAEVSGALHIEGPLVDCALLADTAALRAAATMGGVFANATADQKAEIIAALRADGRCVGMVGDGVNDIAAFRAADCSVAMAHGCEAARSAAQLVLLDESLLSLPAIVREGQSVISSVTRTAELYVKKSMTSFFVLLIALLSPLDYPFHPMQLTLVALFTIGLPAFALTFERKSAHAHGHFVGSVFFEAVPGTLVSLLCVLAGMVFGPMLGLDATGCSTLCVYAYGLSGILVLLHICRPFDRARMLLTAVSGVGLFAALVLLREQLSIGLPTPAMLLVLLPLIVIGYPLLWLLVHTAERLVRRRHSKAAHDLATDA